MAPQVPLPDRLYQGRVQLLEVKFMPVPLFEFSTEATLWSYFKSLPTAEVISDKMT